MRKPLLLILLTFSLASCQGDYQSKEARYTELRISEIQKDIELAEARQQLEILRELKDEKKALERLKIQAEREEREHQRELEQRKHAVLRWVLPFWTFSKFAWFSIMLFALPGCLLFYLVKKKPLVSHRVGESEFTGYAGELDVNALASDMARVQQMLAISQQGASPDEVLQRTAQFMGLSGQFLAHSAKALKSAGGGPAAVVPEEAQALPAVSRVSFAELVNHEDREAAAVPIGLDVNTGNLCQARPDELTSLLISGKPGTGKSHAAKSVILSLLGLYEGGHALEITLIDPHFNAPDGLSTFFKPVLNHDAFTTKILGTKAIKQGKVTDCLQALHEEAEQRQEKGESEPLQVLVCDELRLLCNDKKHGTENYSLLVELLNDRKFGFFCLYLSQDFTGKALGGTGISGLGVSSLVLNSKESKARVLIEESKQAVNLKRGQAVLTLPGNDSAVVVIPSVSAADLRDFETGETALESEETGLKSSDVKAYLERENLSQNELAERLEITRKDMSFWMNDRKLSEQKKAEIESKLTDALTETEQRKVVNLETRRK